MRRNEDFTQGLRTPGKENHCPSKEFKRRVQMKLTDADFSTWTESDTAYLRQQIVWGINNKCLCGFSHHYINGKEGMNLALEKCLREFTRDYIQGLS